MQYVWALEFPNSNICITIGLGKVLITKKCSAKYLFIDISKLHGPSMYSLSMAQDHFSEDPEIKTH